MFARLVRIWCLGQILAVPALVAAQQASITGRVVDESDQQPLIQVAVIYGSEKGVLTDEQGIFHIENLIEGTYTLKIRYTGYKTREIGAIVLRGQELALGTIALPPAANQLNEIKVRASTTSFAEGYAGSNTYISPRLLRQLHPMGTEDVLRQIPGVNIIGDMGLSNRPNVSIRGSWGRRSYKVLLLEDGSFIAPAPYLGPGAYYNPPSDRIEAIRVIKGAETLLYGPNNMFGVVDYITRRPPSKPEALFKFSGGQRGYTTAQAGYGGTWNQLGTDVQLVYKRFDGFLDNAETGLFNLHTKFYFELDENQSFYFKLGYQRETNNASLAAQTPFTFEADPVQNPFDADEFTSRRYALDVIHKYAGSVNWSLTSKVYGADFARDWWRQKTALVAAEDVLSYVGEDIYRDRYSYLDGLDFGPDDYVRVGRVINDREATTDSKWNYTFAGLQEQFEHRWQRGNWAGEGVAGARLHKEIYLDQFLENDSSRWARSGRYTSDLKYDLWSASFWAKQALKHGRLTLTPIVRFEYVDMVRRDLLAASRNPGLSPDNAPDLEHAYPVFLPGFAVDVNVLSDGVAPSGSQPDLHLFSSVYRGFIAPNSQFAFLVEENGDVTTPVPGADLNMKPELSLNAELGLRGTLANGRISGQVAGFLSRIRNFYAAGQGEVFQSLGEVWIRGVEAGVDLELLGNTLQRKHSLKLAVNSTMLQTQITGGELRDRDLAVNAIHSEASAQELVDKINNEPAVIAYTTDASGQEMVMNGPLVLADLDALTSLGFRFGEGGVEGYKAPYTPPISLHTRLSYTYKGLNAGVEYHHLAAQYAEYANLESETGDGTFGKLPAYSTWDAQVSYRLSKNKIDWEFFVAGRNLTNEIYRSSRLNRIASGVFPGAFRQVQAGIGLTF